METARQATISSDSQTREAPAGAPPADSRKVTIEDIEVDPGKIPRAEVSWLGVSTEEASEVVASQLGLNPGEGLVVTYVAPDSPAARAGIRKNDVLATFAGQTLVLPGQLRKLVRSRKSADTVELTLYRGGHKESVSATLAKRAREAGSWLDQESWPADLRELKDQFKDLRIQEKLRQEMRAAREAMARAGVDKDSVRIEVQHSLEQAATAVRDALRQTTNVLANAEPLAKELADMVRREVEVKTGSTVVVKDDGKSFKTIVSKDDTGTYVILADPKKRLMACDREGKSTFDGPIETKEEQDKVPRDIWKKVKPMLDHPRAEKPEQPEEDEKTETQ